MAHSNAGIKFTISYLAGTNFRLAFCFGLGVPREGTSNGQSVTGFNRQNAFAWRFILVKRKPVKKAAVVLSAAAVMAVIAVSVPTPVEARGGWGWGPGIAGGLIAGALIGGLASSAYGYGPGYGYYGGSGPVTTPTTAPLTTVDTDLPTTVDTDIPITVDTDTIVLRTGVGKRLK
jgi:hypothetical protein